MGRPATLKKHNKPAAGASAPFMLATATRHTMKPPNHLLIEAAARLFADGHADLAQDLRQLARRWTPEAEKELIGDHNSTHDADQ